MCITRDRSNGCIYLSQSKYICKIFQWFNMESAKTLSKPLSMHVQLSKDECPKSNIEKEFTIKIPYHSVVGSLIYAMITIRPDIAFVVEIVSRFLLNLGKKHWEVVKIILRNVGCSDNRKSTLGYIFQFIRGVILLKIVTSHNRFTRT